MKLKPFIQLYDREPRPLRYGLRRRLFNRIGEVGVWLLLLTGLSAGRSHAAPELPVILAFGDSLTAGFGLSPDEALPVQLQAALATAGLPSRIINAGVSGDTTAGGVARLDWALADHPQYALVELGANDALRGLEPKLAYMNLDKILTKLQAAHVKVLLLGMEAPRNWGAQYDKDFAAIYPQLAADHKVPLYPFILDGVAFKPEYVQADGLHPNNAGVKIIVQRLLPYVKKLLTKSA